ncbi:conjugal transfer protein TrbH (plasmid) [Mesorhizobium sp. INR15]|nr:conjugal transfer protein TrbH [Mesorhizobium sp. INR15]
MSCFGRIRPVRSVTHIAAIAVVTTGLAACQTAGKDGVIASTAKVELSPASANAIAGDMVSKLAEVVGPGKGTIVLKPDGSPFGTALETSLKGWGYAVASPNQKTEDAGKIHLAYVVDGFEGSVLARLSTSTVDLGRVYSITGEGASPSSPLFIMRHG